MRTESGLVSFGIMPDQLGSLPSQPSEPATQTGYQRTIVSNLTVTTSHVALAQAVSLVKAIYFRGNPG
jgi:hypothetical protein